VVGWSYRMTSRHAPDAALVLVGPELRGCLKTQARPRSPGDLWSSKAGYGRKPLAPGGRGGNQWLHFETVKDSRPSQINGLVFRQPLRRHWVRQARRVPTPPSFQPGLPESGAPVAGCAALSRPTRLCALLMGTLRFAHPTRLFLWERAATARVGWGEWANPSESQGGTLGFAPSPIILFIRYRDESARRSICAYNDPR